MNTLTIKKATEILEQIPDSESEDILQLLEERRLAAIEDTKWEKTMSGPVSPGLRKLLDDAKADHKAGKTVPLDTIL